MAAKPKAPPPPINTYGLKPGKPQHLYDMFSFAMRRSVDFGVPARLDLFKKISELWIPGHFEWHSWTERVVEGISNNMGKQTHLVGFPGCAGSAKTYNVTGYAVMWWLCYPEISSVTFVSTTKQSLRKRNWAEVQRIWSKLNQKHPGQWGNMVDSRLMWQCIKGDDKCAITGRAVEEGSVTKVADDIKGVHTRRQMVVIEEATAIPEAIWDAIGNLYSYPEEFVLVANGNPRNYIQRFGRFTEPANGWNSVSIDTEEWEGKPQPDIGNAVPSIIRFDAEKSPNILEGKIVSKHLPTKEKVEAARKSGGENSPNYWTNFRGFPPPEGLCKTVFSMSAFEMNGGYNKVRFSGQRFSIIGAVDPAFNGGDQAMIRFAKMGMSFDGKQVIEVTPPFPMPLNALSTNPIHYQLAEQIQRLSEKIKIDETEYSCRPENIGLDATGEGGGTCDILARTWSNRIIRIEFGAAASESQVSLEDVRPGNEVWENRRVEMYFRARQALDSGQLKGIDRATAEELSTIEFDDSGKRIKLISKKDYRKKYGKSPDSSDSLVEIVEVARRRGFRIEATGITRTVQKNVEVEAASTQSLYDDKQTFQPEEIEMELV